METLITDRRSRLIAATSAAHRALDDEIRHGGYFASVERYALYLHASLGARQELEAGLREIAVLPPEDYETCAALEQDLRDLGFVQEPRGETVTLDEAEAWGTLYVLQGSSMGALHLRRWAAALGLSDTHGARHLALQAERAGSWRGFVARLNEIGFSADQEAACIAGAEKAFSRFAKWLGKKARTTFS